MTVGGTAKSKWTSAGFFADVVTALTAVGATIKGAVADGASAVAVIVDNTIALATAGAKIISFRHNAVEKLYIDKDGKIDGASTLALGATTGTTITIGRSGQTVSFPGTVSFAVSSQIDSTARLTSDYTNATTTLSDVTGLSFAVDASGVYEFVFMAIWKKSNADGWKHTLTGPASPTQIHWTPFHSPSTLAVSTDPINAFSTVSLNASGVTAFVLTPIWGILINGANAGTVQLQAAAYTSGTLTVSKGSYVRWRKVA
jgi:hypothetical protein